MLGSVGNVGPWTMGVGNGTMGTPLWALATAPLYVWTSVSDHGFTSPFVGPSAALLNKKRPGLDEAFLAGSHHVAFATC